MSAGKTNPGGYVNVRHESHPETRELIEGVLIPDWEKMKSLAIELHRSVAGLRYAGWDLCQTQQGLRVVEGNALLPNPDLIQAHQPILLDARVRAFMLVHGVISKRRD